MLSVCQDTSINQETLVVHEGNNQYSSQKSVTGQRVLPRYTYYTGGCHLGAFEYSTEAPWGMKKTDTESLSWVDEARRVGSETNPSTGPDKS